MKKGLLKEEYEVDEGRIRTLLVETPYLLEGKEKLVSKVIQFDQHHMMNIQLRTGEEIEEHDAKEYILIVVRKEKVLFRETFFIWIRMKNTH